MLVLILKLILSHSYLLGDDIEARWLPNHLSAQSCHLKAPSLCLEESKRIVRERASPAGVNADRRPDIRQARTAVSLSNCVLMPLSNSSTLELKACDERVVCVGDEG